MLATAIIVTNITTQCPPPFQTASGAHQGQAQGAVTIPFGIKTHNSPARGYVGDVEAKIPTSRQTATQSTSITTQTKKPMSRSETDTSSSTQTARPYASNSICKDHATLTPPDTPRTDAASALSLTMERRNALTSELYKITTPYNAEAFKIALEKTGLVHRYPNLVTDIKQGSSIGNPLTHTHIHPT
jgi:hypothetical protein